MIRAIVAKVLAWFGKRRKTLPIKIEERSIKLAILQDLQDTRDFLQAEAPAPEAVDHSQFCPSIKYQGSIGSCGSHAAITGVEMLFAMKKKKWAYPLSEMLHYYWVRQEAYEGTFPEDSGQHGREAMRVLKNAGAGPERVYPYNPLEYNDGPKLPQLAEFTARYWKISKYEKCYSLASIKAALNEGKAVWFGVPITQNFFKARGKDNIRYDKTDTPAGGHAMIACGYDDKIEALRIQNSWGSAWGDLGFGNIDYSYIYDCPWFDAWAFDIEV